ncbi:MAG: SMC-Scp complex subunit ScpB [Clostridia bacterium]|nr:SMC-Scp complex subunit ScpB [Clostridia bacterium]
MKTLTSIIESVLFVSGEAVAIKDIADKTGYSEKEVLSTAKEMQSKYGEDCGINLLIFNKKLQLSSNPNNAEEVSNVLKPIKERELSRSMLEVAAIIAYKQPVTRIDLEELRGSNSEFAIQNLLKLGVIEVVGRKDTVGKPILFGTTDAFLKRFQISSLSELPDYEELLDRISKLRSPTQDSTYLFEKEVYVEESEIKENFIDEVDGAQEIAVTQEEVNNTDDIIDFDEEELPDFLQGEDVEIIR